MTATETETVEAETVSTSGEHNRAVKLLLDELCGDEEGSEPLISAPRPAPKPRSKRHLDPKRPRVINKAPDRGRKRTPRGFKAQKEIYKEQRSVKSAFKFRPFWRLVREILDTHAKKDPVTGAPDLERGFRVSRGAMETLMEETSMIFSGLMGDANDHAEHAKRVTVMQNDLALAVKHKAQYIPGLVPVRAPGQ